MAERLITVARIGAPHGIKGDLKLRVLVDHPSLLLDQPRFFLVKPAKTVILEKFTIKPFGHDFLIHIDDIDDRDVARRYSGATLALPREALPMLQPNEYYWFDLEGLRVLDGHQQSLGVIDHLIATGANDVMVVKDDTRERLIPYHDAVVKWVDLEKGEMGVDWERDF